LEDPKEADDEWLVSIRYWMIAVSSAFVFSATSAAASHNHDIFDLFINEQRPKAAGPAASSRIPRSYGQNVHMREGGDLPPFSACLCPIVHSGMNRREHAPPPLAPRRPRKALSLPEWGRVVNPVSLLDSSLLSSLSPPSLRPKNLFLHLDPNRPEQAWLRSLQQPCPD
jgi:hypothetical protein